MKKQMYKHKSMYEIYLEKIHKECTYTGSRTCDACPYAVFDEEGSAMCYKDAYEHCMKGDLMEYFAMGDC